MSFEKLVLCIYLCTENGEMTTNNCIVSVLFNKLKKTLLIRINGHDKGDAEEFAEQTRFVAASAAILCKQTIHGF